MAHDSLTTPEPQRPPAGGRAGRRPNRRGARLRHVLLVVATLAFATLLVACAAEPPKDAGTAAGGSMGMGGGASGESMMDGVIASAANANITVAADPAAPQGILIEKVVAPDDGWVVVRSATAPGAVLGKAPVRAGETRGLTVPLDALDGVAARITLHVDRGERGEFEFDPRRMASALDKPVYADGQAVERTVALPGYGIAAPANGALILVSDQAVTAGSLTVRYLIVPGPSWICVNVLEDGKPGRRIGLVPRSAGEWHSVVVPLDDPGARGQVLVTLLADQGVTGRFDRDERDPFGSADRPYTSAGVVVSQRVTLD